MANKPGGAVAGHVEFGDDANAAVAGVGDEVANFVLGVVQTVGALGVELGEFFAFGAEALIFGEVPVEDVHFHGFEAVEIALEDIEGDEVAGYVDHQAAPGETRFVLDGDGGGGKAVGGDFNQLQESLQGVHGTEGSGGVDFRAVGGDGERVGFVFAEFLDFFAGVVGVYG